MGHVTWMMLICSIYLMSSLPPGVTAVIRRQFFPEDSPILDVVTNSNKVYQHVDNKYCSEPCTTMVLEATAQCHLCVIAHPQIPGYMQMLHWQLVSDVLIALAYFSIPVELLFFIYRAQVRICNV